MSLLEIDKRAVTSADGQRLIAHTFDLHDPLGVPTIYLSREQVKHAHSLMVEYASGRTSAVHDLNFQILLPKISALMSSTAMQKTSDLCRTIITTRLMREFAGIFTPKPKEPPVFANLAAPLRVVKDFADQYPPSRYHEPVANIVLGAGEENGFFYTMATDVARLQGADKFYPLWHEIAHGTGAGEPQADMMAAVVTRQAFAHSHAAAMWADERAVRLIFNFHDNDTREKYGWGCVDANDFIAAQSEEKILGLDETQIKNMRFKKIAPLGESVVNVGAVIRTAFPHDRSRPVNLMDVAQAGNYIARAKFAPNTEERYICDRFVLACRRIHLGSTAYTQTHPPVPPNDKYPSFIQEPEI